jgi:hypothetical protein
MLEPSVQINFHFQHFVLKIHVYLFGLQVHSKGINIELVEKFLLDLERKFKGTWCYILKLICISDVIFCM